MIESLKNNKLSGLVLKVKISTLLFPIILVSLFFGISLYFFNKIEKLNTKVAQLSVPRVISTLELEININEAYNSILDHTNHTQEILEGKGTLDKYYNSTKNFNDHLNEYIKLSNSLNTTNYARELKNFYNNFMRLSNDLIEVDRVQKLIIKDKSDLIYIHIEKGLDEFLQIHLKETDTNYAKKLQSLDELEINSHELISAVRGFLIRHDKFLFERIEDSKNDLKEWGEKAKTLDFRMEDKIQLDLLLININILIEMSDDIIKHELQKTKLLKEYSELVNSEFHILIDDIVALNILNENQTLIKDQSTTVNQAIASIIIYSIFALIFVYYMARVHYKNEENEHKLLDELKISLEQTTNINNKLNHQIEYSDKILNTQTNFTIVTNGRHLKKANQAMLNFFGFNNLDEFLVDNDCICDYFIDEEGYLAKENNGKNWFEIVKENPENIYNVKIKNAKDEFHIFEIIKSNEAIITDEEKLYVVTLNDVTMHKDFANQLTQKVQSQLDEIRKKDFTIFEQAKMAALGDMIANIAHQWRQPLGVISISASGLKMKSQFNKLDYQEIERVTDKIVDQTKYLSETIDVFRDFIKEEKTFQEVVLQDRIDKALNIVNSSLKSSQIDLQNNIDYNNPIKINLVVGELTQVLINIFNNAKDAILENSVEKPWIKLELKKEKGIALITIEDNAGGIPEHVLPKIFEPYFTTKHQSQGTGLGLHMSYKIIVESLHGKMYAKNTNNGAKFFIEIPTIK